MHRARRVPLPQLDQLQIDAGDGSGTHSADSGMVVCGLRTFGYMLGPFTRWGQGPTNLMAQSSPPAAGGHFRLGGVGTSSMRPR